ncbi:MULTISPECIES: hypothetical protein [unclassified Solwaraspora]|uniref:hypothetical protein n=1 Tax=unclassified Solwaraspora TaxID=2627926 RepID=UPI00248C4E97|nr:MULTISPECIES: hypothetical protein [unclassified Solwaraspora]WBB99298.1 hypothetical protein O7553_10640 [Solwaraspora sp. WMMA2059]WBC22152.1 hypothetical protein O7543_06735 [Solwaraspora sp. WMMA2080]WJK35805.1 hypothetical protein O7610_05400 [Solwaraspora sp. WMMA2065]
MQIGGEDVVGQLRRRRPFGRAVGTVLVAPTVRRGGGLRGTVPSEGPVGRTVRTPTELPRRAVVTGPAGVTESGAPFLGAGASPVNRSAGGRKAARPAITVGTVAPLVSLPGASVTAPLLEAPLIPSPPSIEATLTVGMLCARSPGPEPATVGPTVATVPTRGPAVAAEAAVVAGPAAAAVVGPVPTVAAETAGSVPRSATGFPSAAPAVVVTAAGRLPVAASVPVRRP